jgi:hypothetical protein
MFLCRFALSAAIIVFGAPSAGAQALNLDQPKLSWAIGGELHHQEYREPSLGVREDGWFGGLTVDGRAEFNAVQLRGEGRLAYGQMDYSGSGTLNGINDIVFEARLLAAYAFAINSGGDQLTPYVGYGYRRLVDYLGGSVTSTGAAGYDRLSQYHYIPLGIEATWGVAPGWSIKPTIEYDYFVTGSQDSYLSQVARGLSDVHNTQNSGYGMRGSVMAQTHWGATPVEFGPFFRYWNIDRSETAPVSFNGVTIGGGFEPANHTTEAGLGLKFWF